MAFIIFICSRIFDECTRLHEDLTQFPDRVHERVALFYLLSGASLLPIFNINKVLLYIGVPVYVRDFDKIAESSKTARELYQMLKLHPDGSNPHILWLGVLAAKS